MPNNSKYVTSSVALFGTYFLKTSWKWQYSFKRKLPGAYNVTSTVVHLVWNSPLSFMWYSSRGATVYIQTPFQNGITNYIFTVNEYFYFGNLCSAAHQQLGALYTSSGAILESQTRNPKVESSSLGPAGIVGGGSECTALSPPSIPWLGHQTPNCSPGAAA